jgi:cytochrome c biogenesis protein ResB
MIVFRSLYRFFSSRSLAIILLLGFVGVALVGGVIAQLGIAGVKWVRWLALNDLFQARWVAPLVVALMLNLLLCSLNRARTQFLTSEQIRGLLHFRQIATAIPIEDSYLVIEDELKARRFRIRSRAQVGSMQVAARWNGFSLFGSLLFHLSLVIAIAGFMVRSRKGFDCEFTLFPEQTGAVVSPTGDRLQIQLMEFGADYSLAPGGSSLQLRQRRSHLIVYRNNRFERVDTLSINHPVYVDGLGLFQADPIQVFVIRVRGPVADSSLGLAARHRPFAPRNSRVLVRDTILRLRENEPFVLAGRRYAVGLARLGAAYRKDSVVTRLPVQTPVFRLALADTGRFREQLLDTLRAEQSLAIGDQELSLLNIRQGTKIACRYDPALPWFYVAGAVFLLGMLLRLILPAYEFYAAITEEEGETVIRLGGRALGFFTSLRPLVNRIVDRLSLDAPR